MWIPGDGVFSAPDVAMGMARKAKQLGETLVLNQWNTRSVINGVVQQMNS